MIKASGFDMLHLPMEPQYPFAYWVIYHAPVVVCSLFSKTINKNLQKVKWFESRSGWAFCLSLLGSKLFVNVISYQQTTKLLLDKSSCKTKVAARQKLLLDKSCC